MVKGFCIMICILKRNWQSILLWQQTKELVPWENVRHPTPRTTSAWSPNAHCPILETAPHLLLPEASVPSTSPGGITQEVPCREGPDTSHHCCVFRPLAQSEAYICWVLVGNKQVILLWQCVQWPQAGAQEGHQSVRMWYLIARDSGHPLRTGHLRNGLLHWSMLGFQS